MALKLTSLLVPKLNSFQKCRNVSFFSFLKERTVKEVSAFPYPSRIDPLARGHLSQQGKMEVSWGGKGRKKDLQLSASMEHVVLVKFGYQAKFAWALGAVVRSVSPICVLIPVSLFGGRRRSKLITRRGGRAPAPAVFTAMALQRGRRGKAHTTLSTDVVKSSAPAGSRSHSPFLAVGIPRQDQWGWGWLG